MIKDEKGQWLLISGLIVSTAIIVLSLLLNQAMITGHQSSQAILEFPKHAIRELVMETHREVKIAAYEAWNITGRTTFVNNSTFDNPNLTAIQSNFTNMTFNYTNSIEHIYAYHGQMASVTVLDITFYNRTNEPNNISKVNVSILFDDGVTNCTYRREVIECY